jgi:hypothetical protein
MNHPLGKLLYDSGVLHFNSKDIHVDFTQIFANPSWMRLLANHAAKDLEDYAIDALSGNEETLPYAMLCCESLALPLQYVRHNQLTQVKRPIQRSIHLTLMTPDHEEINSLVQVFNAHEVELVGIYSLLGVRDVETTIRLLSLVKLKDILETYRKIHLITEDELNLYLSRMNPVVG